MAAVKLMEVPTLFYKHNIAEKVLSRITIWPGDITRIAVDAIVNAANSRLAGGGGVDGAIHAAAGSKELREETRKFNGCKVGKAVITSGCKIAHIKHIIHTVGPQVFVGVSQEKREDLLNCYRNSLEVALQNGCKTVAFCCISTGVYGYPNEDAAKTVTKFLIEFLEKDDKIERIVLVTFLKVDQDLYEKCFDEYADAQRKAEKPPENAGTPAVGEKKDEKTKEEKKKNEKTDGSGRNAPSTSEKP